MVKSLHTISILLWLVYKSPFFLTLLQFISHYLHFNATATFLFPLSISVGYSWVPQRIVPGLISFSCSFPFHSVTAEHFNTIALLQKLFQLINGPPELHYSLHEISERTSSNSLRKQYIWFNISTVDTSWWNTSPNCPLSPVLTVSLDKSLPFLLLLLAAISALVMLQCQWHFKILYSDQSFPLPP